MTFVFNPLYLMMHSIFTSLCFHGSQHSQTHIDPALLQDDVKDSCQSTLLPVTTSPTPVSDPVTFKRSNKPIMGNIVLTSKYNLSAWTGGKPLAGWIGLNPSISNEHIFPNQLRPVYTSAFQQG